MLPNSYHGYTVGDRVTVKIAEKGYDYDALITPDMEGTLKAIAPKVRLTRVNETTDRLPYFGYVEFDKIADMVHNNHFRGGVDFKNLRRINASRT